MSNTVAAPQGAPVPPPHPKRNTTGKILYLIFKILLPLAVLIGGGLFAQHLLETGPQAKPRPKKKNATVVKTIPVRFGTHSTFIDAMGVVKASQSIALRPQVSGKVVAISDLLLPGGKFEKGDRLLQLDPSDYQLLVRQQKSAVAKAKSNLELEEGNQIVARRELALLGEQVSKDEEKLMLRKPQLKNLQIALEIAEAQYEQAQLQLDRTNIMAPFNGIVQSRDINIGTWVSSSTPIGTLIGSDSYWVEASVPEGDLKWITFPQLPDQKGSKVKINNPTAWDEKSFRVGRVIQLLPSLESQGRMARLLIEVEDPLSIQEKNREKPKILVGSFVRVSIEGKVVEKALELSREYLRDGKNLWIYTEKDRLGIREVSVTFKNRENVLITDGVHQGEKLIISSLAAPVEGMKLRQSGDKPKNKQLREDSNNLKNKQGQKNNG